MTDKSTIKQWTDQAQRMLEANRPGSLGHALLDVLAVYEAARAGDAAVDLAIREGLAKGFELWRVEQARQSAVEQAKAKESGPERNKEARENQMGYRNQVRDQAADFLWHADDALQWGGKLHAAYRRTFKAGTAIWTPPNREDTP